MKNAIEERDMRFFILTNTDLVRIGGKDDSTIEDILSGLERVTSRLPAIQWLGVSETSIYNLRMKKYTAKIIDDYTLEGKTEAYASMTAAKGVMSVRADSLGELKMLAEAHRKRMNLDKKGLKNSPVRLSVRLALENEDIREVNRRGFRDILEEMGITDAVRADDIQVMSKDEADNMTAKAIYAGIKAGSRDAEDVVIVDKARENRTEEEAEGMVLVEYEGLASARLYDIALDVLAHSDDIGLKTIVGKVAELVQKGRLWVILKPVKEVDTEALRNEMDKYHRQILIMA
jgi:hypothetical protein